MKKSILLRTLNPAGLLLVLLMQGCSTVPVSGRRQLLLIPASQITSMAGNSYRDLLSNSDIISNTNESRRVVSIGKKVSAAAEYFLREKGMASDIKNYSWEFKLIKADDTVNAFCMPGGKIVFYTGIFKLASNDDEIAVVMGHEIAHAVARHGNERMSQQLLLTFGNIALENALKDSPDKTKSIFMTAYGVGGSFGVLLPYSRKHEYEADEIGMVLMSKAGYDPYAALKFWEKMSVRGSDIPEFLSTHPSGQHRIKKMKTFLASRKSVKILE